MVMFFSSKDNYFNTNLCVDIGFFFYLSWRDKNVITGRIELWRNY